MFGVILMRKEFDEDELKKSTRGKKNNQKMKPFLVYQYLMRIQTKIMLSEQMIFVLLWQKLMV